MVCVQEVACNGRSTPRWKGSLHSESTLESIHRKHLTLLETRLDVSAERIHGYGRG